MHLSLHVYISASLYYCMSLLLQLPPISKCVLQPLILSSLEFFILLSEHLRVLLLREFIFSLAPSFSSPYLTLLLFHYLSLPLLKRPNTPQASYYDPSYQAAANSSNKHTHSPSSTHSPKMELKVNL
jgi:hypothetical protein